MDNKQEAFDKEMSLIINSICMSIRHDYGLMGPVAREKLKSRTYECIHAISKEVEASNLLPTEGVCPECGGSGEMPNDHIPVIHCKNCKKGKVQLYYTPEKYLEIIGEDFPDEALVWYKDGEYGIDPNELFTVINYAGSKIMRASPWSTIVYIVQRAQGAPSPDYRPEV